MIRNNIKTLAIIGYGVLGKAVYSALSNYHEMCIVDPPLGYDYTNDRKWGEWAEESMDGFILCLPTPEGPDGECDADLIRYYLTRLPKNVPILVKSTINPKVLCELEDKFNFTYSPEFLREATSNEDFAHQEFAIYGGKDPVEWHKIFVDAGVYIGKVSFTSIRTAGYIKYTINTFLATKVLFFNELYDLFASKESFQDMCDMVSMDPRIGDSHMMVPGLDGKRGYGGMCFPKDTKAFAHYARNQGKPLKLLEKAIELNEEMRKK